MMHREVSAGSGLGLTGCVLAAGSSLAQCDYEELDRYNPPATGRASGRGSPAEPPRKLEVQEVGGFASHRPCPPGPHPEARALWTQLGLRQALDQGESLAFWPLCPRHGKQGHLCPEWGVLLSPAI